MRCEIEEQVKWEAKKEETKRIRKKEKKNEAQERKSGEPKSPDSSTFASKTIIIIELVDGKYMMLFSPAYLDLLFD